MNIAETFRVLPGAAPSLFFDEEQNLEDAEFSEKGRRGRRATERNRLRPDSLCLLAVEMKEFCLPVRGTGSRPDSDR